MGLLDLSDNVPSKKHVDCDDIQDFDNMNGHDFEYYCADILRKNNFEQVEVTQGSGDQGVDIIAYKDGLKYAIQCKNYSSHLGNTPVQEVFAGKTFYKCHIAVVMTNQTFTKGAIDLADSTGVLLWDRYKLISMLGDSTAQNNTKQQKSQKMRWFNNVNNAGSFVTLLVISILIITFIFIYGLTSLADIIRAL